MASLAMDTPRKPVWPKIMATAIVLGVLYMLSPLPWMDREGLTRMRRTLDWYATMWLPR